MDLARGTPAHRREPAGSRRWASLLIRDDETGFWESRDTAVLVASVRRMNHIIAACAGKLSDEMPTLKVDASIFEHPEFEWIEMEE